LPRDFASVFRTAAKSRLNLALSCIDIDTYTTMFGALRPSSVLNGGLLWKVPYRLSNTRKANLRQRLKRVDSVIAAVAESGVECRALTRALELPKESEMPAKGEWGGDARGAHRRAGKGEERRGGWGGRIWAESARRNAKAGCSGLGRRKTGLRRGRVG
jgi:hypothetical protein